MYVDVTVAPKTLGHPRHPNYVTSSSTSSKAYYMNGMEAASYHVQRGLTYRFQMEPATWLIHPLHLFRDGVDGAYQN